MKKKASDPKKIGIYVNRKIHPFLKSYIDSTGSTEKPSLFENGDPQNQIYKSRRTLGKDETDRMNDDDEELLLTNLVLKPWESGDALIRKRRHFMPLSDFEGQSPLSVKFVSNYKESEHKLWVKPFFSNIVYKLSVSNICYYNN